jgi:putative hydrolase of the HAD superfamily
MERIKSIVFDLGGVIFLSDGGSYEGREKLAKRIKADKEKLHELWFKDKENLITGKMSEKEFLKKVLKLSRDEISLNDLREIIREENKIDDEMVELLKKLNQKYFLVILNNEIKEWNEYRIKKFKLKDHFRLIVSSCDVGFAKPTPEIYKILLNRLNMLPGEIIFIDNRLENLVPAENLGIKTHLFKDKEELINWFNIIGIIL